MCKAGKFSDFNWSPAMSSHHGVRAIRTMALLVAVPTSICLCPQLIQAQPADGQWQPDRVSLGTVYVGAMVEASVRVLIRGEDSAGVETRVSPPPFLRVTQTRIGTQTYGNSGTFIYCDV